MVRTGRQGEREAMALEQNRVLIGWHELGDLSDLAERADLQERIRCVFPDAPVGRVRSYEAQGWAFVKRITVGDIVAMPLKSSPAVAIGRIDSEYEYVAQNPEWARHSRRVTWLNTDVPRATIPNDLLRPLSAYMTVCEIGIDDAPDRLVTLASANAEEEKSPDGEAAVPVAPEAAPLNIEELGRNDIRAAIGERYKEHEFAYLVDEVLKAKGFVTTLSPRGPDGGADILAGKGPLGTEPPKICVQVKSGKNPVPVGVVRELLGVLGRVHAEQGLLVAWGGLTSEARRECRDQFFKLRYWESDQLIEALTDVYDRLPADIQNKLPLTKVWTVVRSGDETAE